MKPFKKGERIIHRGWKYLGVVVSVPKTFNTMSRVGVKWDSGRETDEWIAGIMPLTEWRVRMGELKIPKLGARVKVKSIGMKGKVFHIDNRFVYRDHFLPIQITLDKPYKDPIVGTESTMYRTSLPDVKILKKKKPEKELLILEDDDDELLILDDDDDEELIILDDDEDEPVKKEKPKKKKKKV